MKKGCCDTYHEHLGEGKEHYSSSGHSVTENQKTFRLKSNKIAFCKIKVDGGLYKKGDNVERCDWVFVLCETNKMYFVELKGSGVPIKKPYKQITGTIQAFNEKIPVLSKRNVFGAIVGGSMPKNTPTWRRLQEEFRKNYGNKLDRKDPVFEV